MTDRDREGTPPLHETTTDLANPLDQTVSVVFEPWGMPIALPPGQSLRIATRAERPGELGVVWQGRQAVVYGWPTSRIVVHRGEDQVFSTLEGPAVPDVPAGVTMQHFLERLFRPKAELPGQEASDR